MTLNMGSFDRNIRLVLAAFFTYLYFNGQVTGTTGIILLVLAVVFAATSLIGVCPLYLPFGFPTIEKRLPMSKDSSIVDVRTREEFKGGHVAKSINIPLQELEQRMSEIKKLPQPIVLCCASGNRSARATAMLKNEGIDCQNGGSWLEVNAAMQAV